MPAFERLLVPMDLSEDGSRALRPAMRIARRRGASLTLFNWSSFEDEAAGAKRYLLDVAGSHATSDVTIDVEVTFTRDRGPAPAIAAAAERVPGTVICMATHARSGVGQAVLGSVAEATLREVTQPIVLVGPMADDRSLPRHGGVVACVDGSALSETVLPVAAEWAHELKVPLRLVHVLEPGASYAPPSGPPDLSDSGYLANLAQRVAGDTPEFEVLHGDAAEAVASYASAHAELVAVTTHGRGGIARTVLGSVAMKIVHRTACPVLVVRA